MKHGCNTIKPAWHNPCHYNWGDPLFWVDEVFPRPDPYYIGDGYCPEIGHQPWQGEFQRCVMRCDYYHTNRFDAYKQAPTFGDVAGGLLMALARELGGGCHPEALFLSTVAVGSRGGMFIPGWGWVGLGLLGIYALQQGLAGGGSVALPLSQPYYFSDVTEGDDAVPIPIPIPQDPPDEPDSCAKSFPEMETCYNLVGRGGFSHKWRGLWDAIEDMEEEYNTQIPRNIEQQGIPTSDDICVGGRHWTVRARIGRRNNQFLGTVTCCPCCNDTQYGPNQVKSVAGSIGENRDSLMKSKPGIDLARLRDSISRHDWRTCQIISQSLFQEIGCIPSLGIAIAFIELYLPIFKKYHPNEGWMDIRIKELRAVVSDGVLNDKWSVPLPEWNKVYSSPGAIEFVRAFERLWRMPRSLDQSDRCLSLMTDVIEEIFASFLVEQWGRANPELWQALKNKNYIVSKHFRNDPSVNQLDAKLWVRLANKIEEQLTP